MSIINERTYIYPDIVEKFSSESTNGSFEKEMEYCIYRHLVWKWPLRFQLFVIYVVSVVDIWKNDGAKTELVRSFRPEQDNALPASFFALSPRLVSFLAIIALTKSVLHNPAWNQLTLTVLTLGWIVPSNLLARERCPSDAENSNCVSRTRWIYIYVYFSFSSMFVHKFFSSINDGHSFFYWDKIQTGSIFTFKWFTW